MRIKGIELTEDQVSTLAEIEGFDPIARVVGTSAGMPVVHLNNGEYWALTPRRCRDDKRPGMLRAFPKRQLETLLGTV